MPMYPFVCDACGGGSDHFSSMSEVKNLSPECCGLAMRRVYTVPHLSGAARIGKSVNGVVCPADGKRYNNMRDYERAVESKGCAIMNDADVERMKSAKPKDSYDGSGVAAELKKAASQHGLT